MVEDKKTLMQKLGKKQLILELQDPLDQVPAALGAYALELSDDGAQLIYTYDTQASHTGITALLSALHDAGIRFKDLDTTQSSLEEIFVTLVREAQS